MADRGTTADMQEHVRTYEMFIRLALMGSLHVAAVLIALVIGTIEGAMPIAIIAVILATGAAIYGLMRPGRGDPVPLAIIVGLSLVAMGVLS